MLAAAAFAAVGRVRAAETVKTLNFQLSWVRSIQYGGYFAGADRGTFRAQGLDVAFASGGPNIDAIANVASGRAELGDRPVGPLLIAREKGIPISVLADLKGKTIAVGSTARPTMLNLFRENGIDPDSVTMVPAAPDPFALVSGQLDAYTGLSTNQGVMLEARGIRIVSLNLFDLGVPETSGVIYGREDFLAANRPAVVGFLRAATESWTWALDHPEDTAKLTVDKFGSAGLEYTPQLMELKASRPYIEPGAGRNLLSIDMAAYSKTIDLYRKTGLLKSAMTVEALCDPSFIDDAHKA
jgi:NitT/TauT family transport system substrate-binding protein